MTEFHISGKEGGGRPVNFSVDAAGNVTDHGSYIGPDGSVYNVQHHGSQDSTPAEKAVPDSTADDTPTAGLSGEYRSIGRITIIDYGDGAPVLNVINGNTEGADITQTGDIKGGLQM